MCEIKPHIKIPFGYNFKTIWFFLVLAFFPFLSLQAEHIPRVVSITPNTTEIILILGGRSSLVGKSSACDYLPEIKDVPIVGNMGVPNIETVLSLNPDAVVSSLLMNPSDASVIENLGIKFYLLPTESFDEYYITVNKIGTILNKQKEAKKEIDRVKEGVRKLLLSSKSIATDKKPKVFWEIWNTPLITIGNKSFLNEFINLAGGISITSDINRNYFEIAKESVISADPDAIIAPGLPLDYGLELKKQLSWSSLKAVQDNRVYTDLDPNLLSVFGPRMLETIHIINDLLYKKGIDEKK
ncbi:MAG TPA: hypothetical protein DD381_09375 [Lentisphaeria bacterium]|nr:MAG: hypothetical protein A2X47_11450 [Lentisphaerae bacterium GWF2_38_69]HBM16534.1 hypothetical protein [Lentisphaeria bacterium]